MNKNEIYNTQITAMSAEGSGIARVDGMAVFVPQTAVGDIVDVRIVKVKSRYAYGIIENLVAPAESRIVPDCPVFKQCGGCVYRHIDYKAECEIKWQRVADAVNRIGGIDLQPQPIISAESTSRYRNKAQYPVMQSGEVGFYATHSHRIIACEDCVLQPEEFAKAAKAFKDWINENNVSVYDEKSGRGLVRHFYLRRAEESGEIMAVVVINGKQIPNPQNLVEKLNNVLSDNLKSVQLNINTADTNVILGDKCITIYGRDYIVDTLCGVKVRLSALSFYQVNRIMAQKLYKKAAEYADAKDADILDLYCGAGTIGLSMAKSVKSVIGVEIVPEAVKDAVLNAKENDIENAEFICADAATAAKELAKREIKPKVVIVDPPRKGCDETLLQTVANSFSPERIVYVSCDPSTLARDAARLETLGYNLVEYTPVDLFPRTAHVETVALFVRTVSAI